MADIRAYKPTTNSTGSGQVLQCPYEYKKARLIVQEMTDRLVLDLVDKGLVTDQIVLTIGYDIENLKDPDRRRLYKGEVVTDRYGRRIPKHAHGTANISRRTSSTMLIMDAVLDLYDKIIDKNLLVRRVYVTSEPCCRGNRGRRDAEHLNSLIFYRLQRSGKKKERGRRDKAQTGKTDAAGNACHPEKKREKMLF